MGRGVLLLILAMMLDPPFPCAILPRVSPGEVGGARCLGKGMLTCGRLLLRGGCESRESGSEVDDEGSDDDTYVDSNDSLPDPTTEEEEQERWDKDASDGDCDDTMLDESVDEDDDGQDDRNPWYNKDDSKQPKTRRKNQRVATKDDAEDDEEGVREFVRREQARMRERYASDRIASGDPASKFLDEGFVTQSGRMSEHDLAEFEQFVTEYEFNQSVVQRIVNEGSNPYYVENNTIFDDGDAETGVHDVLGNDLRDEGEDEDEDQPLILPKWDGLERFVGVDGKVYVADTRGLDHVDEDGFDEEGNFYPMKDLGSARFIKLLNELSEQDRKMVERVDAEEDREVEETGDIARVRWRKHLDEDGYLRPDCLRKNSTFLQENPWVERQYVLPSPTPPRWRGRRIDAAQIGGATAEWDLLSNSDYSTRWTTYTALRHTGVGCTLMFPHDCSGYGPDSDCVSKIKHVCTMPPSSFDPEKIEPLDSGGFNFSVLRRNKYTTARPR